MSKAFCFPNIWTNAVFENNPVRVIDVFVDELDLMSLGFEGVVPESTWPPPATLLKGVRLRLHQPSSVEPTASTRNATQDDVADRTRLTPDFKSIADFSKDNGAAIRNWRSSGPRNNITERLRVRICGWETPDFSAA